MNKNLKLMDLIEVLNIDKNIYFKHIAIKDDSITISNKAHKICSVYLSEELTNLSNKLKPYEKSFDIYISFREILIKKRNTDER
jgi:hypothetical protein